MITTLKWIGGRPAIILDEAMLNALGVASDASIEVTLAPGKVTLEPAPPGLSPDRLRKVADEIYREHTQAMDILAE